MTDTERWDMRQALLQMPPEREPRLFYAVLLNDRRSLKRLRETRWQLYEHTPTALQVMEPRRSHPGDRGELLPFQVASTREGFPGYHFLLPPTDPLQHLATALSKLYRCGVSILPLGTPDPVKHAGGLVFYAAAVNVEA